MRRLVITFDRPHQGPRRAFALQIAVVVREIFHRERHVRELEKFLVLIAVRIEGRGDEGFGPTTSRTRRASSASGRGTPRTAIAPCRQR